MPTNRIPAVSNVWIVPTYAGASTATSSPRSTRARAASARPWVDPERTITPSCGAMAPAEVSTGLGAPMPGLAISSIPGRELLAARGW